MRKQTQIRYEPFYKQLEIRMNRTSFYAVIVTDITHVTQNVKTHNRITEKKN